MTARFVANARMYAVAPAAETAWREMLARVASAAGVELDYVPYPAPQPLETLWARRDLGDWCVAAGQSACLQAMT